MGIVLETERLRLRLLEPGDAGFILELVNDEAWLRFVGDRGVRTIEDARAYIEQGPVAAYERDGFGIYRVEERRSHGPSEAARPIGVCGLVRRDSLPDVDVGYAFLPPYRGKGYATESVASVVEHARRTFGFPRLIAVTDDANVASIRVLEKTGFRFVEMVRMEGEKLALYARDLDEAEEPGPGLPSTS